MVYRTRRPRACFYDEGPRGEIRRTGARQNNATPFPRCPFSDPFDRQIGTAYMSSRPVLGRLDDIDAFDRLTCIQSAPKGVYYSDDSWFAECTSTDGLTIRGRFRHREGAEYVRCCGRRYEQVLAWKRVWATLGQSTAIPSTKRAGWLIGSRILLPLSARARRQNFRRHSNVISGRYRIRFRCAPNKRRSAFTR